MNVRKKLGSVTTRLEKLVDQLSCGSDNEPFDIHAFLEGWEAENRYLDKEEAFIRLLCAISDELRPHLKGNLK